MEPLPPKVMSAKNAMKTFGFSWERTKPVLKDLLRAYEHNWGHIEADNYRVLVDAILDSLELREGGLKKKMLNEDDVDKNDDEKLSLKSTWLSDARSGEQGIPDTQLSVKGKRRIIISDHPSSILEINGPSLIQESSGNTNSVNLSGVNCSMDVTSSSRTVRKNKRPDHQILDASTCYKETNNNMHKRKLSSTFINKPAHKTSLDKGPISSHKELPSHSMQIVSVHNLEKRKLKETCLNENVKNASTNADNSVQSSSSINFELASSTSGEMRIVILCDPALPFKNFQMPSMEVLGKMMEDRCLKLFKFLDPQFSLLSLLEEMCNFVMELGFKYSKEHGSVDMIRDTNAAFDHMNPKMNTNDQSEASKDSNDTKIGGKETIHSSSKKRTYVVWDADICRGEENVKISLSSVPNAERYPPSFHYIPRNIVYQNAYVNISLARIGDEDCCSTCCDDCLAASIPCPCARETGGDYAYTSSGLMKKDFLDAIIAMKYNRLKKNLFFCKDCPIERFRNEMVPEPCKGHLIRKFVKECWSKCSCNRICGNRLVQRGITRNLQVYWTAEGKGWGLRTLDELPRGAFICEYVGEILTNMELYERQLQVTGKMRHTYPVLLDADWGSEQVLKDEEALCLDATFYGNVARFINHRCADANVVEVPVEVETPDHHYYHLAFFTVREVRALEEITWDYGIDFADDTHPIKAFSCHCGSKLCRDLPQIKRRTALVLG